ncbi:MAG: ribonuclease HI family protein [Actinomycetota bacterium]
MKDESYSLHTDGGARGNPGPAGIGAILGDPHGAVVESVSQGIGWCTNNVAEYRALIEGLRIALAHRVRVLRIFMDSELVVNQMQGIYRVKNPGLRLLHEEAVAMVNRFSEVSFQAVPREQNSGADELVNAGIDQWLHSNPHAEPEPAQKPLF